MEHDRLIDKNEAAKILGVSVRQVERLTATNLLPGARKVGNCRRYHLRSLLDWIAKEPSCRGKAR